MAFKIRDRVGVMGGELLDSVYAAFGEIDFPSGASVNIRDSKGFPCKFQLTLIGSADNQNHNTPPNAKTATAHSSPMESA